MEFNLRHITHLVNQKQQKCKYKQKSLFFSPFFSYNLLAFIYIYRILILWRHTFMWRFLNVKFAEYFTLLYGRHVAVFLYPFVDRNQTKITEEGIMEKYQFCWVFVKTVWVSYERSAWNFFYHSQRLSLEMIVMKKKIPNLFPSFFVLNLIKLVQGLLYLSELSS